MMLKVKKKKKIISKVKMFPFKTMTKKKAKNRNKKIIKIMKIAVIKMELMKIPNQVMKKKLMMMNRKSKMMKMKKKVI